MPYAGDAHRPPSLRFDILSPSGTTVGTNRPGRGIIPSVPRIPRRLGSRLFAPAAGVSLGLCVAACVLWVRSSALGKMETIGRVKGRTGVSFKSGAGKLFVFRSEFLAPPD